MRNTKQPGPNLLMGKDLLVDFLFFFQIQRYQQPWTRWWFRIFFVFIPTWGKVSILTNIFQICWNHQPWKLQPSQNIPTSLPNCWTFQVFSTSTSSSGVDWRSHATIGLCWGNPIPGNRSPMGLVVIGAFGHSGLGTWKVYIKNMPQRCEVSLAKTLKMFLRWIQTIIVFFGGMILFDIYFKKLWTRLLKRWRYKTAINP